MKPMIIFGFFIHQTDRYELYEDPNEYYENTCFLIIRFSSNSVCLPLSVSQLDME